MKRFSLAITLVCENAKIAMLELTDKSFNAITMYVKVSVIDRTTTVPIDVCVSVTAKSLVDCVKHSAKFNANTSNATRNAKSPAHRALKIAHGRTHIVNAVRCSALSSAVFFHVSKDAKRRSAAIISVRRYAMKSVLSLNIVRSALSKISKAL